MGRWNFDTGRPASHFDTFFVALLTVFQVIFYHLGRKRFFLKQMIRILPTLNSKKATLVYILLQLCNMPVAEFILASHFVGCLMSKLVSFSLVIGVQHKMLSYRRETALQGALQFLPKVEDWNWETIFYGHYRSIFNHCDIIGQQSY